MDDINAMPPLTWAVNTGHVDLCSVLGLYDTAKPRRQARFYFSLRLAGGHAPAGAVDSCSGQVEMAPDAACFGGSPTLGYNLFVHVSVHRGHRE